MSSSRRKFMVKHPVVVDIGCSCRRTKLSSLFSSSFSPPKPKPIKPHQTPSSFSPSTTTTSPWTTSLTTTTTASTSPYEATSSPSYVYSDEKRKERKKKKKGKKRGVVGESVAVVKESEDPYIDFRDSMLQMIVEKEIYAWEDLKDLLHYLLSLNSPSHHHLILRAFAEICNGVFSPPSPSPYRTAPTPTLADLFAGDRTPYD